MQKLKLKSMELLFENCSHVKIPVKFIKSLHFDKITENITLPYQHTLIKPSQELILSKTAGEVRFSLSKEANSLDILFSKDTKEDISLFAKLTGHKDITSITLFYEDSRKLKAFRDSKVSFGVSWNDENDEINSFQEADWNELEDAFVVEISEK